MDVIENRAKKLLAAGEIAIGMGVRQARTVDIAKIGRTCGYDWLFIDMEHGTFDLDTAAQICVAALDAGIAPIVRVPGKEHHHAARILDGGAQGVVVPHVDTPEEAARVVAHCKYPPVGHRSVAGPAPQLSYRTLPIGEATRLQNGENLVVVMLESPTAIANADTIAAVPGVDVLLIGTSDLCAEMGMHGQFASPQVVQAYETVIAACRRHGKHPGMGGVYDPALMQQYVGLGMRFILSGSDLSFLMAGARERAGFLKALPKS
jgi:2-keto-3-deoxy-L-rhamnonate aldolase RhmA